MTDWQPISTAPKDGAKILIVSSEYPWQIAVVWWGDINAADSEYGTVAHEAIWCWLITDEKNDPRKYRGHVTHWMPLPTPPKEQQ